jgi:hypothetical protein
MAKAGIKYIDAQKFQAILEQKSLLDRAEPQAGFVKVQSENGHRLYVAKTKRVGRVDLAFTVEGEGFHAPENKNGSIQLQLDMTLDEEAILANFARALDVMKSLPKVERAKKAEAAKGPAAPKAVGWTIKTKASDGVVLSKDDLLVKMAIDKKRPLADKSRDSLNASARARYDEVFAPKLQVAADKS